MDDPNSLEPETDEELVRAEAFRRLRVPRPRPQGQTLVSLPLREVMPKTSRLPSDAQPERKGVTAISEIKTEKDPPAKTKGKSPTAQEYAEQLVGQSLSPEETQPARPSLAKLRADQSMK